MNRWTRRTFLVEVGRGMITAGIGVAAAKELGFASTFLLEDPPRLTFGALEPLVELMATTPPEKLNAVILDKLKSGTSLRDLVAAAALANARAFGGEDYVGYHTMMALAPSYRMALETPERTRPLPVLKVLRRNTQHLRDRKLGPDALAPLAAAGDRVKTESGPAGAVKSPGLVNTSNLADELRAASRAGDLARAEAVFAASSRAGAREAFNALLETVQDAAEVHRVALPHRAWDLVGVIGEEHAHVLLRQSVHYCVQGEPRLNDRYRSVRALLTQLLEKHHLLEKPPGARAVDDAWIERTSSEIFAGTPESAAGLAAAALADGVKPESVGEAVALAANQLLLRDAGRPVKEAQPVKGAGSVHGDSIGVHACDSANAWRGMARAGNARNTYASLILGAQQVAFDRAGRGGDFLQWAPWPTAEHLDTVKATDPGGCLREAEAAIRANDQARACAAVARYGALGAPAQAAFDMLLRYATSEDGALHAEKYYRTAREEFDATRPAFRWRHACSLARVTASEFGYPAPGQAEARAMLGA
jgi:hypothetical protein